MEINIKTKPDLVEKSDEIKEGADPHTSWEGYVSHESISPLVLRKYLTFLCESRQILFGIFMLIVVAIVCMSFKFLLFTEHEKYIFDDGTDETCIYNPSTGEFKQNEN